MPKLTTIDMILKDPDLVPGLLDDLERMSSEDLDELSLVVFNAIHMKDRDLSLATLKRIIALRPEWVNEKDEGAWWQAKDATPLMQAISKNCFATVDFLLKSGANIHATDSRGRNALYYATNRNPDQTGQDQICESLLEKGGFTQEQKDIALYHAAQKGNLGVVKTLLAHGADLTEDIQKGATMSAACLTPESDYSTVEIVQALLQSPRARQVINSGWNHPEEGHGAPIHCAALRGNTGVLSLLVSAGAWVNPPLDISSDKPTTPLMSAAMGAKVKAIQFLINAGADASLVNNKGHNALHHLANSDPDLDFCSTSESLFIQSAKALLEAGADPFLEDGNGLMPQDTARENENLLLADYLASVTSARKLHATTATAISIAKTRSRM